MKFIYAFTFLITTTASCQQMKVNKQNINANTSCIQQYIDSNKNKANWMVGTVEEYEFQGKIVYALGPTKYIADGATFIKTSDCKDLCTVGGFRGTHNSNCNGANFFEKAVFKRRIWQESKTDQ
jgi:hypothetical protein